MLSLRLGVPNEQLATAAASSLSHQAQAERTVPHSDLLVAFLKVAPTASDRALLAADCPDVIQLVGKRQDVGHLLVTRRGKPLCANDPNSILSRIGKRAGVRVHPYALRRACASHLVEAGVGVRSVQMLLGHASLEATELYVGVSRNALRRAVRVLETE